MNKKSNPSLYQLCHLLNDLEWHDGTSLGKTLQLTRAGIWKQIQKLQRLTQNQMIIESHTNKGYQFNTPLYLLSETKIRSLLEMPSNHSVSIEIFETIDSTNTYLLTNPIPDQPTQQAWICLAENQMAGKGRFNRSWQSHFGQDLCLSLKYVLKQKDITELNGLSLAIGVLIIECLECLFHLTPSSTLQLKWPNDIYHQNQKLCGILVETHAEAHGQCTIIIGIGINVNADNSSFATLSNICDKKIDRNLLSAALINSLLRGLQTFEQFGFTAFHTQYTNKDWLKNKKIQLQNGAHIQTGYVKGVDSTGRLILQTTTGEQTFTAGEATLHFTKSS